MANLPRNTAPVIAIVDDHAPFGEVLCRFFRQRGYRAEAHCTVQAFIQCQGHRRAKCIILDVAMPEIDGLALQKCLNQTNYNVPIIFCSGTSDERAKRIAVANGAVAFLTKPPKPEELLSAVKRALREADRVPTSKSRGKQQGTARHVSQRKPKGRNQSL